MIRTRALLVLVLSLTANLLSAQETAKPTRPRFVTLTPVFFATAASDLDETARTALERAAEILQANADAQIAIVGHADERGAADYNERLGLRRAQAVRAFLEQRGVNASRVDVSSAGEREPANSAHNEEAWSQNRRVEFRVRGNAPLTLPKR